MRETPLGQQEVAQVQQTLLAQIKTLEAERRAKHTRRAEHLEKARNHWNRVIRSFCKDTERASQWMERTLQSSQRFTDALAAIQQDCFLTDKNEAMRVSSATFTRQQQALAKQRAENMNSFDASLSIDKSVSVAHFSLACITDVLLRRIPPERRTLERVRMDVLVFQQESEQQAQVWQASGDSIVNELLETNEDIERIHDAMLKAMARKTGEHSDRSGSNVLSNLFSARSRLGIHLPTAAELTLTSGPTISLGDVWLLGALYRAAVARECSVWEEGQMKLESLRESLENYRRYHAGKLSEWMAAVLPAHQHMFHVDAKSFQATAKNVSFGSQDVDVEEEEDSVSDTDIDSAVREFEETIQKRSSAYLRATATHRSSIMNRSRTFLHNENAQQVPWLHMSNAESERETLVAFGHPLSSELVVQSLVVEQWVHREWVSVLVVLTHDRYFHLFEVPDFDPGVRPEMAFASLCKNSVYAPATYTWNRKQDETRNYVTKKKWMTPSKTNISVLRPAESFNLKKGKYASAKYALKTFDIFQEHVDRVQSAKLRFSTYNECSVWLLMLKWGYDHKMAEQHMAKAKMKVLAKKRKEERQAKTKQPQNQKVFGREATKAAIQQSLANRQHAIASMATIKENPSERLFSSLKMDFLFDNVEDHTDKDPSECETALEGPTDATNHELNSFAQCLVSEQPVIQEESIPAVRNGRTDPALNELPGDPATESVLNSWNEDNGIWQSLVEKERHSQSSPTGAAVDNSADQVSNSSDSSLASEITV